MAAPMPVNYSQPAYAQPAQQPAYSQNLEGTVQVNAEMAKFKDVNQKAALRDYALYWLCVIVCGAVGFFVREIFEMDYRILPAYLFIFPLIPAGIAYYIRKSLHRETVTDPLGMNKKKSWFRRS